MTRKVLNLCSVEGYDTQGARVPHSRLRTSGVWEGDNELRARIVDPGRELPLFTEQERDCPRKRMPQDALSGSGSKLRAVPRRIRDAIFRKGPQTKSLCAPT